MKRLVILCFVLSGFVCRSQNFQREINEQVWIPFITSFGSRDTKSFIAVHSKDVVRVLRDSKELLNFDEYLKRTQQGEKYKNKLTLELRFNERIADQEHGHEVGVYKTTSWDDKGESQSFYGRFHVVLRKENGTWKILVDSDSSENESIGEKEFLAANAMQ